jgi:hypothetical protein
MYVMGRGSIQLDMVLSFATAMYYYLEDPEHLCSKSESWWQDFQLVLFTFIRGLGSCPTL